MRFEREELSENEALNHQELHNQLSERLMIRGRKKAVGSDRGKSLREQIISKRAQEELKLDKREIHVMTRLSKDTVEIVDALVTLNVFKSRSEAVAAYVESSIMSNIALYEKIADKAKTVEGMRNNALESVLETFQKRDKQK